MQGPLDFLDLCRAWLGKAIGIMPELFLVDPCQPFKCGLGEDFAIQLEKRFGVHPENQPVFSPQLFRNGIPIFYAGFFQDKKPFFKTIFYLVQRIPDPSYPGQLFHISGVVLLRALYDCM